MTNKNQYQRIVPFILFILTLFLLFILVKPMITIILGSMLLAYITFPLYQKIKKKISNNFFAILFSLMLVTIIILIPFTFLTFVVTQQGLIFYDSLSTKITKGAIFGFGCTSADSKICLLINQAEKFSAEKLSIFGFDKQLQKFLPILEGKITEIIFNIPIMIAQIFLALVIAYFILKDRKIIFKKIISLLPIQKKTINQLRTQFDNIAHTVIYAQLFVAMVQGIVGTIGFYIFGAPFPIILGVLVAFGGLIPTFGTAIIWLPTALFLILSGYFSNNYLILSKGIGLFIYGILVINIIDNVLLAKIVHSKAKVNQILIIVGVIGGANLFGIIGIFIGPILLPLLVTYFEKFKERFI